MRILFFSESPWSIPSILEVLKEHEILGVVISGNENVVSSDLLGFLNQSKVKCFNLDEIEQEIELESIDMGVSFGFTKKIPESIFSKIKLGVINIHFGELPKYAGPSPLFWVLKNQEPNLVISFHRINDQWDAGHLLMKEVLPIFPGEPIGLLGSRAAFATSTKLKELIKNITLVESVDLAFNNKPLKRPTDTDLTIEWRNQKANEIEALINAANPSYGGAISSFRGSPIRILEVSPADVNITGIFSPGTIVYSDPQYGVFVICGDYNFLRINILQLEGTIISGQKLAALGVRVYEKFE
ncbi:methionyl-tRNA formyltransferase [Algoriphagus zhangzhouensis]|uniref:Methionyl-tRNA formyltransferase n=1 Tax=Algoriphagus zhangzhouensis TaxID=1073327 RepID=A0A1M7ZKD6_9BACT|nr:formyltransferase family protein [Algoriphagus zhangzhouensis]TDY43476.1 methionyl-tRNA formyltransferase [Algoriphagus zhangzhouensis]SHO65136.1 methionyl-tRNA formyltransferase [Algoriphagus zhangzhouensis]